MVSTHGADGVLEIIDIDLLEDLSLLINTGTKTTGLAYIDELVGGLIAANYEELHAAITEWQESWNLWETDWDWGDIEWNWDNDLNPDAWRLLPSWAELWASEEPTRNENLLWFAWDRVWNYSDIFLSREDLERRFTYNVQSETAYVIFFEDDSNRVNIFFHNQSNESVFLVYALFSVIGDDVYVNAVEVAPNRRYNTQLNLDDFLDVYMLDVTILNPDGTNINGEFAFRWTVYPPGHPSHTA